MNYPIPAFQEEHHGCPPFNPMASTGARFWKGASDGWHNDASGPQRNGCFVSVKSAAYPPHDIEGGDFEIAPAKP